MVNIGNDWDEILAAEWEKDYYKQLRAFLVNEYRTQTVYPPAEELFSALRLTPCGSVKAVILGQDPYYNAGQAHGLCFSVKRGVPVPPSLQNIFKELHDETGADIPNCGDLTPWAKQGVLLLNAVLTVRAGSPLSHKNCGWEILTDNIIRILDSREQPIVFLLWGNPARAKARLLSNPNHLALQTVHPSPLSAYNGFFGCGHFNKANEFLTSRGAEPIDWRL